jgi:hypothetical protein
MSAAALESRSLKRPRSPLVHQDHLPTPIAMPVQLPRHGKRIKEEVPARQPLSYIRIDNHTSLATISISLLKQKGEKKLCPSSTVPAGVLVSPQPTTLSQKGNHASGSALSVRDTVQSLPTPSNAVTSTKSHMPLIPVDSRSISYPIPSKLTAGSSASIANRVMSGMHNVKPTFKDMWIPVQRVPREPKKLDCEPPMWAKVSGSVS